jgi:hypothetical protein
VVDDGSWENERMNEKSLGKRLKCVMNGGGGELKDDNGLTGNRLDWWEVEKE